MLPFSFPHRTCCACGSEEVRQVFLGWAYRCCWATGVLFQVECQLVLSHAPHPAGDAVSPVNEVIPGSTRRMLHVLCFTSLGPSAECFSLWSRQAALRESQFLFPLLPCPPVSSARATAADPPPRVDPTPRGISATHLWLTALTAPVFATGQDHTGSYIWSVL